MSSSVATVMPEMGLDEEPISPVRRDDTVTNRNPVMTMRMAPSTFMWSGRATMIATMSTAMPPNTTFIGMSWSVRCGSTAAPRAIPTSLSPSRSPCQMTGSERNRLMMPPAATAPAPM